MRCKYYKPKISRGQKTCLNKSLTQVKYCPFVRKGKTKHNKKAPDCCRGFCAADQDAAISVDAVKAALRSL